MKTGVFGQSEGPSTDLSVDGPFFCLFVAQEDDAQGVGATVAGDGASSGGLVDVLEAVAHQGGPDRLHHPLVTPGMYQEDAVPIDARGVGHPLFT